MADWVFYNKRTAEAYDSDDSAVRMLGTGVPYMSGAVWRGKFPSDPPGAQVGWVYYNTTNKRTWWMHAPGVWSYMTPGPAGTNGKSAFTQATAGGYTFNSTQFQTDLGGMRII